MHKDVLFRGCTRPAMFLGVPYIPFFIGAGGGQRLEGGQPVTDVVEREFAGGVLVLRPAR